MSTNQPEHVPLTQTYRDLCEERRRHVEWIGKNGRYLGCACNQYPQPSFRAHETQAIAAWIEDRTSQDKPTQPA